MKLPRHETASRVALASLVGANLIPLVGVVWWGWQPLDLLALYWFETGVIGASVVPKIPLTVNRSTDGTDGTTAFNRVPFCRNRLIWLIRVFLACLFLVGYGWFWIVLSSFLLLILPMLFIGAGWTMSVSPFVIVLGVGALLLSRVVSFAVNYLCGADSRNITLRSRIQHLCGRVVVLFLTLLVGVAVAAVGSPTILIAVLVVLKTGLDIGVHLRDPAKASPPEPDPTSRRYDV